MPLPRVPTLPALSTLPGVDRADRIQREMRDAIAKLPQNEMKAWGKRASVHFREASVRRARDLLQVGGAVLRWSHDEAAALGSHVVAGRGMTHLSQRWRALRDGTVAVAESAKSWFGVTALALRNNPRDAAPKLAASVIGQLIGGGNAPVDQALNGVDLARAMRSPLGVAGDVVAGAVLEAGLAAMIDLARVLADLLPAERDPLWDRLIAGRDWVEQAIGGTAPPKLPPA